MSLKTQESDLYAPIKTFLTALGYQVKGEINDCDIVAKRGDETLIVELKLSLNITLLLQAVSRFTLTDNVYIAVPKQCTLLKKKKKQISTLLSRLGIGLILVDIQKTISYVEVAVDQKAYLPRKNKNKQKLLEKEFNTRIGDTQQGGSTRKTAGITAYRQRCTRVAEYLLTQQHSTGGAINKAIDEPQATQMLSKNYYAWFEKVSHGVYQLSTQGRSIHTNAKPSVTTTQVTV